VILFSKHHLRFLTTIFLALSAVPAQADGIVAVPTNWRLQDYGGGAINLYYTGAPCTSGALVLVSSAPEGTKDRLWSTILTAKLSNRPVGIFYHVDASTCIIDSFYMDGPS
jgi:hypothetical protein